MSILESAHRDLVTARQRALVASRHVARAEAHGTAAERAHAVREYLLAVERRFACLYLYAAARRLGGVR